MNLLWIMVTIKTLTGRRHIWGVLLPMVNTANITYITDQTGHVCNISFIAYLLYYYYSIAISLDIVLLYFLH